MSATSTNFIVKLIKIQQQRTYPAGYKGLAFVILQAADHASPL
jgi:hypothetical protein